ncbi:hypothetical protein KIN20_003731 [Parelaphostrongylus tenuis]|uniref:Uncharacterized protein n=1 Tax=Parelaphostrongylus tenuis TaxID=148309 RepID=A0AAD5QEM6_PARTN|nr:hypothetical protein KIN20_003731 [Parelaphostrongylus tenuis]
MAWHRSHIYFSFFKHSYHIRLPLLYEFRRHEVYRENFVIVAHSSCRRRHCTVDTEWVVKQQIQLATLTEHSVEKLMNVQCSSGSRRSVNEKD